MVIAAGQERPAARAAAPSGRWPASSPRPIPQARALIAAGFERWSGRHRRRDLRRLHQAGQLPAGTDPDALAVTLLAALQGGLLLAQVQRDTRPLETAVDTLLALVQCRLPWLVARYVGPGPWR
jgi:TetR/AcrR family transcriptional repressor of nem operon